MLLELRGKLGFYRTLLSAVNRFVELKGLGSKLKATHIAAASNVCHNGFQYFPTQSITTLVQHNQIGL